MNLHTILENSVFQKKTWHTNTIHWIHLVFILRDVIFHVIVLTSCFSGLPLCYLRCSQWFLPKICSLFVIKKSNISLAKTFAQQHFTIPKTKKTTFTSHLVTWPNASQYEADKNKPNTCSLPIKNTISLSSEMEISYKHSKNETNCTKFNDYLLPLHTFKTEISFLTNSTNKFCAIKHQKPSVDRKPAFNFLLKTATIVRLV